MAERAGRLGVRFWPHFKTHQSYHVGRIFREFGVEAITVSSVDMASYFAADGWKDILIAFPLSILEIGEIGRLAFRCSLGLLVESPGRLFVVKTTASELKKLKARDILFVLPVHSCLTVNLWKEFIRLDGVKIPTIRSFDI
jgi:D-serine deaminase-like pyridoxal phosphate-dependent protein